jgi:hypothetical protein
MSRYSNVRGCLYMNISKTDNGRCWRMERSRDSRLTHEVNGLIRHVRRWISSDMNSSFPDSARAEWNIWLDPWKDNSQLLVSGKTDSIERRLRSDRIRTVQIWPIIQGGVEDLELPDQFIQCFCWIGFTHFLEFRDIGGFEALHKSCTNSSKARERE